ncbi:MAG TPA: phytanoyl-CoA dioxygenase family protein [Fimbriimonas sp.]|nr:phytanoyl-CoA dioxygenase family protein [Fimbriimonas sp.]
MPVTRDFHIVENYRPERPVEAPISEEDVARFADDGYIHLPAALTEDQCKRLREATDSVASKEGAKAGAGGFFLRHLMDKDEAFLELLNHPLFLPIARIMLGPMVRVLPVTARVAVPGEPNQSVEWHIHQRLVPRPLPPFFSQPVALDTLIYLDDVDEETGPLQVVPGSHRITQEEIPNKSADQPGQVTLMPKAGDAIMTHGNVWHRALPTTEKGRRRRLIIFPFGPAWVALPTYGVRPKDGLLDKLAASADPDMRELLGDCERIY